MQRGGARRLLAFVSSRHRTPAQLQTESRERWCPEEVKAALDARDAPIADDSTRVLKLKRAAFQDIFEGDTPETAASLDLGKVQMFYVTVALVLGYGIALGALFAGFDGSGGISELPNVDQAFVGLLGISHVGYLATKAAS